MTKELILITAGYPYGNSETFLETEILYLSQAFDHVKIIAVNSDLSVVRDVPENCELLSCTTSSSPFSNFLSLRFLLSKNVFKELSRLKKQYQLRLSGTIFKTILVSYKNGRKVSKALRPHVDKSKHQVFYSYWSDDAAIGLSLLKGKYPRLKTIARCHGWDVYFHVHASNFLPFRNLIGENMSLIAPISTKGEQYIEEKWCIGEHARKVEVRRLGVHAGQVDDPGRADQSRFHIVSCSNVIPLKRVHLIVEALSLIQDIEISWTHFGDGELLTETRQLAKDQLSGNIAYNFEGRTSNKEVLAFYQLNKPSLFINMSTSEGIPVSIMEAMSFGTPVFATDVGGTSEIVNNENGLLIPVDITSKDLSERIRDFVEASGNVRENKRQAALETWQSEYNADSNYTKFAEELTRIER